MVWIYIITSIFTLFLCGVSEASLFKKSTPHLTQPTMLLFPVKDKVTPIKKMIIDNVKENQIAYIAGIKNGDEIISVDGLTFDTGEQATRFFNEKTSELTFRILRNLDEKTFKLLPNRQTPKYGFTLKFIDEKGSRVYPTNLVYANNSSANLESATPVDAIFQYKEKSMVTCGAAQFGRVVFLNLSIFNYDEKVLEFKPRDSVFFMASNKRVLTQISTDQAGVLTSTRLSTTDEEKHFIPSGTSKLIHLYFDTENNTEPTTLPYSVKINVNGDEYTFDFLSKRSSIRL